MLKNKLILFFVLLSLLSFAQNTSPYGNFYFNYFSQKDFQSATQIWTGVQHSSGEMLFGNNNEILSFNGVKWKIIKTDSLNLNNHELNLVNKTKVAKLFNSSDRITFVGRENNFGKMVYSPKGELVYKPIFIADENKNIGEIWNIFELNKKIYFICENAVFYYFNNQVKKIQINGINNFYCKTAGALEKGILLSYRKDENNKILRKYLYLNCSTNTTSEIEIPNEINFLNIRATEKKYNYWNIFNYNGNVHRLKEDNSKLVWLKDKPTEFQSIKGIEIYSVVKKNDFYIVSTDGKGIQLLDNKTKLIRHFNDQDGMENLIVHNAFFDNENNIWACLSIGIHFIETSSPISVLDKRNGLIGKNFNIEKSKTEIKIATENDVWSSNLNSGITNFKPLKLIPEEIYEIKTYQTEFGTKTIGIAYSGVFDIDYKKNKATKIIDELAWSSIQNPNNKNEFFIGNEGSLGVLSLKNNQWSYKTVLSDLSGDIINLSHKNEKIYFGIRNSGIYEFDIKTNKHKIIQFRDKKINLNTNFFISIFQDKIFIGMESGLYQLDEKSNRILPFSVLNNKFLGNNEFQIHRIYNENDKKLWIFIWNENRAEHGYLEFKNNNWLWTSWPFEPFNFFTVPLASSFQKISDNEYWFTNGSEILSYNHKVKNNLKKTFKLSIDGIYLDNKLVTYNPNYASNIAPIEYKDNSIRFEFSAKTFMGLEKIKYRYKLTNYIENWSEWSEFNFADFKKLSEGTYTINIQAKNFYGFESQITKHTFTILPPWYRTWWAYTFYVISFIVLIYLIIRFSIQRIKNQNIKLEEIVEERTSEIAEQNKKLEIQKQEIEHKTQDIVDSIIYAKRIQETILPDERLAKMFQDYCVFYRPKDIVSGDFYWARQKGDLSIFSAIDCTGHGVPGALVSIVGNASLLRCVNEHRLTEPAEILDKHREIVVKSFVTKTHTDVKDGMDMSLCVLDQKTLILKYAGANNECVIIRNKEIIELKPDKQPIGQFSYAFPFTQQEIQLQKGDCIFLYTDGYVDQFGGDKGKKLKSRPFKEFLKENSHLTMKEQYFKIENYFEKWKADYDQVDDVCVFGIKI